MSNCHFQNNTVVCSKHKSEVCGACCSDYALFNQLINGLKDDNTINKAIKIYFKKPKKIARAGANRVQSPQFQTLLNKVKLSSQSNLIDLVSLSGFMCFTARFSSPFQSRILNILKFALESYAESSINDQNNFVNDLKKEQKNHAKSLKKRKKQRKNQMKQKEIERQNKLKKKGIRSRIKNKKATVNDKLKSGEMDIMHNVMSIMILLTEAGCNYNEFGSFIDEIKKFCDGDDDFISCLNDLQLNQKNDDDLVQLNDTQINSLKKAQKMFEFISKYGTNIPCDDPKTWNDQRIAEFLTKHNIIPKPKPSRDILIKVCIQLIEMKSTMMLVAVNMDNVSNVSNVDNMDNSIAVDAQESISMNLNPFILQNWSCSIGIGNIFGIIQRTSLLTTKPFVDLQESLLVIAKSIDKYDVIKKVPMFVMQDKDQTEGISILILSIKEHQGKPFVIIKYFKASRGMDHPERMIKGLDKGTFMQEIPASLIEIQLFHRLLKKNRNKLLKDVVKEKENEMVSGWRLSAFMPYSKGEKKCPSCNQLAKLRCSRCKIVGYCSRDCQKIDWKSHKKMCRKYANRLTY